MSPKPLLAVIKPLIKKPQLDPKDLVNTVTSRSHSQGTELTTVIGAFPLDLHETSQRILHYGNDIQSRRESGYEQPLPVTHSAKIEYTALKTGQNRCNISTVRGCTEITVFKQQKHNMIMVALVNQTRITGSYTE